MSPEDRARIARENGAKSKGPITEEGKDKVAANAIKTGEHITKDKFAHFLPPHPAVICNEDRGEYYKLLRQLIEMYRPGNQLALSVVRDIATMQWQVNRLDTCLTVQWNIAIAELSGQPGALAPELIEMENIARSTQKLSSRGGIMESLNRQAIALRKCITHMERRITFIHKHFPNVATEEQTQPEKPQPAPEDEKQTQPENTQPVETEPVADNTIYLKETSPAIIQAYRLQYPNRKIVILPADDMPFAPRKAA